MVSLSTGGNYNDNSNNNGEENDYEADSFDEDSEEEEEEEEEGNGGEGDHSSLPSLAPDCRVWAKSPQGESGRRKKVKNISLLEIFISLAALDIWPYRQQEK